VTTTEVDLTNVEDRVRRLLVRADDLRARGEDGEADSTLANAERIALKYGLDAARLAATQPVEEREPIEVQRVQLGGIYRVALRTYLGQFATTYGTTSQTLIARGRTTDELLLVGPRGEVRFLKMLVTALHTHAMASMHDWWNDFEDRASLPGMSGYKARRQYLVGFVRGAERRVREARRAYEADGSNAVALRSRRADVDAHVRANFSVRTSNTRLKPGVRAADTAGYEDGRRADVAGTSDTANRRQITS